MQRPHVRIDGDTLNEVSETWSHAQNDAHGLFLWLAGQMIGEGVLELDPALMRVVSPMIRMLAALPFYKDVDSGMWKERRAVRASSIGAVCAGLRLFPDLLHDYDHALAHIASDLYEQGMEVLRTLLPYEVRGHGERAYDAALLFLVEPLGILTDVQAKEIVDRARTHLMRERGVIRYERDAFWGPDYKMLSVELRTSNASVDDSFRAAYAIEGKEAQWTLLDPLLAVYFAKKGDCPASAHHLNRSLAGLVRSVDGTLLLPELYYYRQGTLVPNTIVPLYMAQAQLLVALTTMPSCG